MTDKDWKTLRVPLDAYTEAKAQKKEHGRTWGQQIVRGDDPQLGIDYEKLADMVAERVKRAE